MAKEKPADITFEQYAQQMETFVSDLYTNTHLYKTHPAQLGYFSFLKQLVAKKIDFGKDISFREAARGGHINILSWIEQNYGEVKQKVGEEAIEAAATDGHLDAAKHLNERFTIPKVSYVNIIARSKLNVIEWMTTLDKYADLFKEDNTVRQLYRDSAVEILDFYIKNFTSVDKDDKSLAKLNQEHIDMAAQNKQVVILKHLSDKGIYPSKQALDQIFNMKGGEFIKGDFGKWYVMNDIENKAKLIPGYSVTIRF